MTNSINSTSIDKRLVALGLAPSISKAKAFVMAGIVLVNNKRVEKASEIVSEKDVVRLKNDPAEKKYVGRGGLKLEKALKEFKIRPKGLECLDVGSSTGGFTDCLLQNDARIVFAVDVGTNQLVWKLRNDPRVIVRENVNARTLTVDDFPAKFDLITIDVSFISVRKILPALKPLLKESGRLLILIKPQFEAAKKDVGKGGIVRITRVRDRVVKQCVEFTESLGFEKLGLTESPITGADGNREFLAYFKV